MAAKKSPRDRGPIFDNQRKDTKKADNDKEYGFPLQVIPKYIQEKILHDAKVYDYSIDILCTAHLFAVASATGNALQITAPNNRTTKSIFWILTVIKRGEDKSSPLHHSLKPLYRHQKELKDVYNHEMNEYRRTPENKRGEIPKYSNLITDDTTPEGITKAIKCNPHGMILHTDEFHGFLDDLSRYNKSNVIRYLIRGWDGSPLSVSRGSKEDEYFADTFIPLIGNLQPEYLSYLFDKKILSSGFTDRILFLFPEEKPTRETSEAIQDHFEGGYRKGLETLLNLPYKPDNPVIVSVRDDAKELYASYWKSIDVDKKIAKDNKDDIKRSVLAKMQIMYARFVLTLFETRIAFEDASIESGPNKKDVKDAYLLYKYFLDLHLKASEYQDTACPLDNLSIKKRNFFKELPALSTPEMIKAVGTKHGYTENSAYGIVVKSKDLFEKESQGLWRKRF